jgi:hypothetical protein
VIREWADLVSRKTRGRGVRTIPGPLMRLAAMAGDILKACGMSNPPITSFRLRNMRADTSRITTKEIQAITGPLPFDLEEGVERTIAWMRTQGLLS